MAAISYSKLNNRRELAMRRTAPISKRIKATVIQDVSGRHQSAPQPSRLEQMQAKYQQKLMKEKEDKMVSMHQRQQEQGQTELTLQSVRSAGGVHMGAREKKSIVRDFFKERRQMEKNGRVDRLPAPGSHLQKMRSEQETLRQKEQLKQEELQHFARTQQVQTQGQQMRSGYTKSKPLAPIKKPPIEPSQTRPPFSTGHFETVEKFPSQDDETMKKKGFQIGHKRPKRPPNRPQENSNSDSSISKKQYSNSHPRPNVTPPRNLPKIAKGRKPSLEHRMTKEREERGFELSDFQKWQLEQDKQREARLHKYQEKLEDDSKTTTYDMSKDNELQDLHNKRIDQTNANSRQRQKYENMKNKERELEAMIMKHQQELMKLDVDDSEEEDLEIDMANETNYRTTSLTHHPPIQNVQRNNEEDHSGVDDYQIYKATYDDNKTKGHHSKNTKPIWNVKKGSLHPEKDQSYVDVPDLSEAASFYVQAVNEGNYETSNVDLRPCQICGRQFNVDRLATHKAVCQKNANKKRKVFDSTKHRTEGTDMSQYVRRGKHLEETSKNRGGNWKQKHEEFVRTVKDARKVQVHIAKGGKISDLPPPRPTVNADYKQCPYCKRNFNQTAAERHITHCKNTKNRPKPPPKRR